jgi:hypothetical protein
MDVVAVDLTRVALHWVIGTEDQGQEQFKSLQKIGLVQAEHHERTLAVFNGGFQARHGRWGMMSHGITVVPAREHGCTLFITLTGKVNIAPWPTSETSLLTYRQGPPCLLHENKVHEQLLFGNKKQWAGQAADLKTRRRSALGINAERTVLFYAVGTETEAVDLARGMASIGAETAMQLDINWNWTRFLIAGRRNGEPRVTSTLIPDMAHGKSEYFNRPSARDFFYLAKR